VAEMVRVTEQVAAPSPSFEGASVEDGGASGGGWALSAASARPTVSAAGESAADESGRCDPASGSVFALPPPHPTIKSTQQTATRGTPHQHASQTTARF
jgi:hypothetical protein